MQYLALSAKRGGPKRAETSSKSPHWSPDDTPEISRESAGWGHTHARPFPPNVDQAHRSVSAKIRGSFDISCGTLGEFFFTRFHKRMEKSGLTFRIEFMEIFLFEYFTKTVKLTQKHKNGINTAKKRCSIPLMFVRVLLLYSAATLRADLHWPH